MKNSNKVIINTGIQYSRSIFSIVLGLYTSRVVLLNLGVDDFGIYSLVAGVITMLSFIQSNLSRTNIRFFSYYRGKKDLDLLKSIFNNSVSTQIIISVVICLILLILTDPIFNHFLNIAPERIHIAKFVYFMMIISLFFNFLSTPYLANIISHEDILYANIVQFLDTIFKLFIALSLIWISSNRLGWYAASMMLIIVLNFFCYFIYCRKRYIQCRYYDFKQFNFEIFKEMLSFMGWSIYGTVAVVLTNQGLAVLLNKFFSTSINAAYGIAYQVSGQLSFLSSSIMTAINPQIIKAEGSGNRKSMIRLSEISCKFSFLMYSMLCIPIIIYMPEILKIWLKIVPEHTSMLCRFVLLIVLIDLTTINLNTANQAVGKIRNYTLIVNSIKLLTIPFSFIVLKLGYPLIAVMITYTICEAICTVSRVIFLKFSIGLSIRNFTKNVIFGILPPFTINLTGCYILSSFLYGWGMIVVGLYSIISTSLILYYFCLTGDEKIIIDDIMSNLKKRLKLKHF